jgi:hypothetical protein
MKNSKFIKLLRLLDVSKIAEFEHYLKCFYANEEIALQVMVHLRDTTANFSKLAALDFPDETLHHLYVQTKDPKKLQKNLHNTFSDLHRWLKELLILQRIRQNDWTNDLLWLQILDEQDWLEQYEKKAHGVFKSAVENPPTNSQNLIQYWAAAYYQFRQQEKSKVLANPETLKATKFQLGEIGNAMQYKIANAIETMRRIRPDKAEENEAPSPLPSNKQPDLAIKSLYQSLLALNLDQSEASYAAIVEKLPHFIQQLDPKELHGPLRYLKNYLATQMRKKNDKELRLKYFELNKIGVENEFFKKSDSIFPSEFLGIIGTATAVQAFDWASEFIRQFQDKVDDQHRNTTVVLSTARILVEKNQYTQALDLLESIQNEDQQFSLFLRLMTIQCYYELGYWDLIYDYIEKYKINLTQRKNTPKNDQNLGALNALKIVKLLLDRKKEPAFIRQQIDSMSNLHMRIWLLEKLNSYKIR